RRASPPARAHPREPEPAQAEHRGGARLAHRRVGLPGGPRQRAAGRRVPGAPGRRRSVPRSSRSVPRRHRAVAGPPRRSEGAARRRDGARAAAASAQLQLAGAPPARQRLERRGAVLVARRRSGRSGTRYPRPPDGHGTRVQHGDGPLALDLSACNLPAIMTSLAWYEVLLVLVVLERCAELLVARR